MIGLESIIIKGVTGATNCPVLTGIEIECVSALKLALVGGGGRGKSEGRGWGESNELHNSCASSTHPILRNVNHVNIVYLCFMCMRAWPDHLFRFF